MIFNKKINDLQETAFDIFIIISYFLTFIYIVGISKNADNYLKDIDYYVRIYICLFLIWRFHPFSNTNTFTKLDKKIAFSAGLFIFSTTILSTYLIDIQNEFKIFFKM